MGSTHPYYRRSKPKPQNAGDFASDTTHIDFTNAHMPAYPSGPVELSAFNSLFDARAAAAVSCSVGFFKRVGIFPSDHSEDDLLEFKFYGDKAPKIYIPKVKCLAAMAYPDYFPEANAEDLWRMVSEAILASSPGWCGTFGPGVDSWYDVAELFSDRYEGNYDMAEMHLLQIAYRYYDHLSLKAREKLITELLVGGRVHRLNSDETFTSGGTPNDWSRAGHVTPFGLHHIRIGETENHILMILTARYLTNQLLYQRNHDLSFDNRRNGTVLGGPNCMDLVLSLLRDILADDFSEYNAKPYQHETRTALLNLCSYAYDREVSLAARMVLDYISAHVAISSNDLRRMVPFRRKNEGENDRAKQLDGGFMDVGLLEWFIGADPMVEPFAIQAGNTRVFDTPSPTRPWPWAISGDGGDATMEALSDYRLPPSIHDLFVNDMHRRFFQRLHRAVQPDIQVTGRNCDNMEIYAGSPSYLITAGGSPATWAVFPDIAAIIKPKEQAKQLGVAVTTSFMPTGLSAGLGTQNLARDLIQFSSFSATPGEIANYGVAPDFACGHQLHLPGWLVDSTLMQAVKRLRDLKILPTTETVSIRDLIQRFQPFPKGSVRSVLYKMYEIMAEHLQFDGQYLFINKGSSKDGKSENPGFYLAIFNNGNFAFLEAFDTWLHPGVTFDDFKGAVMRTNPQINIQNNVEAEYKTQNGNTLHFVIWKDAERDNTKYGAKITRIEYGDERPTDIWSDAGNTTEKFLSGTIMKSPAEAVVEITNPFPPYLGTKITLDMSDQRHPIRISETGEIEEGGGNHEVWVDFDWAGPNEGDFFRPFNTIAAAAAAVADGGVIKIMPGSTRDRPSIKNNKRFRLVAPIGGVNLGAR